MVLAAEHLIPDKIADDATSRELFVALSVLVEAWDELPAGHHRVFRVQDWIKRDMGPAVLKAKDLLVRLAADELVEAAK